MTPRKHAHKVDSNQPKIVAALREAGVIVRITSDAGKGFPDLICALAGINYLMEVKNGVEPLTPDELIFHRTWPGQIAIVRTPKEALAVIFKEIKLS